MSRAAASNVVALRPRGSRIAAKPRKAHVHLAAEARARLAGELVELDQPGKADYRHLARQYGVSVRTVENIARQARDAQRTRNASTGRVLTHPLPENTLDLIGALRNSKQAWRELHAAGDYRGNYATFARRINDTYGKNVVRGTVHGTSGMDRTIREKLERRPFLHAYTIDLFSLRAPVLHGRDEFRPMAMIVREDHTDVDVTTHVFDTDAVTAAMVATVLGQAFRGRTFADAAGEITLGGLPDLVVCDNGSNFLAAELDTLLDGLGVRVLNTNSYSSWENGAHERGHRTARDQLLRQLPGSSDGPTDTRGRLMDTRTPLTLETVRQLLAVWAWKRNTGADRPGTVSPLERWRASDPDGTVARFPAAAEIAALAVRYRETCRLYKLGVRVDNEHYFYPEMSEYTARRYVVRRWFDDADHAEIFDADGTRWLGTATRNGAHTAAEAQALSTHREQEKRAVSRAVTAGAQLSQRILADAAAESATDDAGAEVPADEAAAGVDALPTPAVAPGFSVDDLLAALQPGDNPDADDAGADPDGAAS